MKGVVTLKDKMLRIRVDSDFLSKLEYLKQINGFKTIAETVRKLIEKEFRKETQEVANNSPELAKENGELISRKAAIDAMKEYEKRVETAEQLWTIMGCKNEILKLPSAQPQRMRAKWIATTSLQEGQITWRDYKCSNCSHHKGKPMNFCEVCGAKMER